MITCVNCGASLPRLEAHCSYCGAANPAREELAPKVAALLARGIEAVRAERHADAVEALSEAVAIEPQLYDAYFYLASAWSSLGLEARAIDAMKSARELRGGSAVVAYNLGVLLERQQRRADALAEYAQAQKLAASDPTLADRAALIARIEACIARLSS